MAGNIVLGDIILIGEFCEVSGPRAVLTIPTDAGILNNNEHFNLEEFLLYIMTTDYQNFSGEKWAKTADVMCVRTNIMPDFHAVLHYFTLKDPQARGCVRPSCIAYVTRDQMKLDRIKNDVAGVFDIAAQILKHSNIRWMQSIGQIVTVKENAKIAALLRKWNPQRPEPPTANDGDRKTEWTNLCKSGSVIVLSGLLKLYTLCSRSLRDHILERVEIGSALEMFGCENLVG